MCIIVTRLLLLLLPLVRTVRKGAEQIEENYTEPAFDWSSVFAFIKWVLVVAGAVAVIILAAVGILILIEVYKANRSYLRSIRHKSYRAAVRGTVREMVEQEMEFALQDEDTYPYFFGGIEMKFWVARARRVVQASNQADC